MAGHLEIPLRLSWEWRGGRGMVSVSTVSWLGSELSGREISLGRCSDTMRCWGLAEAWLGVRVLLSPFSSPQSEGIADLWCGERVPVLPLTELSCGLILGSVYFFFLFLPGADIN